MEQNVPNGANGDVCNISPKDNSSAKTTTLKFVIYSKYNQNVITTFIYLVITY